MTDVDNRDSIFRPDMKKNKDIRRAADIIKNGGVVAFPTETVYGLGANALDAEAVSRIFAIKQRPHFDPLIVHVAKRKQIASVAAAFPELARKLADAFWPGPLTMILPKRSLIPDIVTSGLPTVAIRIPDHPIALELIETAGVPIAAPSANPFGRISPSKAEHVQSQIGERVDLVLNAPPCRVGVESTIIAMHLDKPYLLRPGGIPVEEIESITGPLAPLPRHNTLPEAPGQLRQHYAPGTPVKLASPKWLDPPPGSRHGLLAFQGRTYSRNFAAVEILSPDGNLQQAAARLFEALHRLDAMGLDLIVAEIFPNEGLGLAINDRLQRAAGIG